MKINRIERSSIEKIKSKDQTVSDKVSFKELMSEKRDQKTVERLTGLLNDIKDQGKILSEKRTVDNLMKYKKMVKEFMDEAVDHGLNLEKRGGFRRGGRSRILKIVSQVDKKLMEVTDAVIKDEKKGLNILRLTGEIEGLLINIYA
ncbi:YaaR family protein [Sporosalibacterium faouarense]|uniref:YaaR family protein n=1 Tax=Sporosalibacterium faouarense TaxID=516123 RepID=UPI00141D540C|nr:YaaR family protein [Sporosalibacterium faouarense]MTI46618.1 DUF327 family protein [Bacillota bacterium]